MPRYTEDVSIERLDIFKPKQLVVRPIAQIRRALRRREPISEAERQTLLSTMDPEAPKLPDESVQAIKDGLKRDDGAATMTAPDEADAQADAKPQVSASNEGGKANTPDGKLHGAAAKAAVDPEEAAMELAPPGPDHEAFGAHDEAVATTQKAIVLMERANGPQDKTEAVQGLFDAALAHKAVARQFEGLAAHLTEHDLVGAPKARAVAKAHHDAATAIETAATTGFGVHYRKAHAQVKGIEPKTKDLSATLTEAGKKRAVKSKKAQKPEVLSEKDETLARLDGVLQRRK
jgi:hypothetical protein